MKKKLDLKYLESHLCYLGCDFKKINTKKNQKTDLKKAYNILKSIEKNINIAMKMKFGFYLLNFMR